MCSVITYEAKCVGNGTKSRSQRGKLMRFTALTIALFLGSLRWTHAAPLSSDRAAIVDFAQKAAVRALDYNQGDRDSVMDAQEDFTPDGWREFMKWLNGWLDDKGAPLGSSHFSPTSDAVVKSEEDGVARLTIPGTLKQLSRNEHGGVIGATYRAVIEIKAGGNPVKILHLKATTCGGASTVASCE
jgi:hypothetical protein